MPVTFTELALFFFMKVNSTMYAYRAISR